MIRGTTILSFFGVFVVMMAAQVAVLPKAMAYEETRTEMGVRLRLTSLPARVRLDTPVPGLSDGGQAAVLRSIFNWNAQSCVSPLFVLTDEDDGVSIEIVPVVDGWRYGSAIAAHTRVDSDQYRGDIRHVVIEIDGRRKWSEGAEVAADALDLESILLHELGHAVGLDHSRNSDAIMRAGIKPGQTRRRLHEDDLVGICDILKYSQPRDVGSWAHLVRLAQWSPWFLASILFVWSGVIVIGAALIKRIVWKRIRLRSFCRIGN